jgi:hypothetical protein
MRNSIVAIYEDKSLDKIIFSFLLINSLLFPLYVFGKNTIHDYVSDNYIKLLSCVGIYSIVHFGLNRDYYLPFLGDTVFPSGLLGNNIVPNNADITIEITIEPNTKIVYWAAEPCQGAECKTPIMAWDAYKNYENSGIVTSNSKGIALIRVRSPQSYKVPYKRKEVQQHVHYRKLLSSGMLSKVYTHKTHD